MGYPSKAAAKRARRRLGHRELRAYFCGQHENWHLGHLPASVRRGVIGRGQIYGEA